ncbi:MAG TPA: hypothetical protein VFV40_02005 [Nocardioides sp.]|nr:hypothetical protein [Nocardioides sp.]
MTSGPTPLDRAASVPLAVLGVVLLARTNGGATGAALGVLTAVLGALAVVAAARMWCRSCFESRLLGVLVATAATFGQLLAVVVGPPGAAGGAWTLDRLLVLALGVGTLALLGSAGRGRLSRDHDPQPYAR